jgi:SsrA-binding protein
MAKKSQDKPKHSPRVTNRRARFNFHILEVVEAGLVLQGTEVKSLRASAATMEDAFVRVRGGQAILVGLNISAYPHASPLMQHDPKRDRKLLLHARQIERLESHARLKGNTVVPVSIYFKDGWAKCEVGLAVGKKQYDKRRDMQEKQQKRDIAREMHRRSRDSE